MLARRNKQLERLSDKLIDCLGSMEDPKQKQDFMKAIISNTVFNIPILFDKQLTKSEVACLYMAAIGYTSKETANAMNIEVVTVDNHRQHILKKLQCRNITHAVFKAISNGMVDVMQDIDWLNLRSC